MAWAKVQSASGNKSTSGTSFGVTWTTANITANNRVLVAVSIWNASPATTVSSVTDGGNTYRLVKRVTVSDNTDVTLWDAVITSGAGTKPTVTANFSATSSEASMVIREYSGLSTAITGYTDGVGGAVAGTGNASSGASSPAATASNELAYGTYGDGGNNDSVAAGSGWSDLTFSGATSAAAETAVESKNSTSGSSETATFTLTPTGSPWGATVAVFKLASVAAAQPARPAVTALYAVKRASSNPR